MIKIAHASHAPSLYEHDLFLDFVANDTRKLSFCVIHLGDFGIGFLRFLR